MATRSTIAVENTDGRITEVYCHFDGYLRHNGRILLNHYNDFNKALELVRGGNMSSLCEELDNVIYYHRDRKEEWAQEQPKTYTTFESYRSNGRGQQYNYILRRDDSGDWNWWVKTEIYFTLVRELI